MQNGIDARRKFEKIVHMMIQSGVTASTMESCTGGFIASLLTDFEGASAVCPGGIVTYSNEMKIKMGVPEYIIKNSGVYSEDTARHMAYVCRKLYDTDIGIGITGTFANIDPNNADSVARIAFFAIANERICHTYRAPLPELPERRLYKEVLAAMIADRLHEAVWIESKRKDASIPSDI